MVLFMRKKVGKWILAVVALFTFSAIIQGFIIFQSSYQNAPEDLNIENKVIAEVI